MILILDTWEQFESFYWKEQTETIPHKFSAQLFKHKAITVITKKSEEKKANYDNFLRFL